MDEETQLVGSSFATYHQRTDQAPGMSKRYDNETPIQDLDEEIEDDSLLYLLEGNVSTATKKSPSTTENLIEESEMTTASLVQVSYMKNGFMDTLTDNTVESFFRNAKYVKVFGKITQVKMRFGLDHTNKVAKLYIKRDKFAHSNPSILPILWTDIGEISSYLEEQIKEIDTTVKAKRRILKPDGVLKTYLPEKPIGQAFWASDYCFYTDSGSFRCRITWSIGNVYSLFFNLVKVCSNDKGEEKHYTGPKIRLVKSEVVQFLEALKEIKKMVPEDKIVQQYINKIK